MAVNENNYNFHESYTPDKISIGREGWSDKEFIDIKELVLEFNIYEDLFSIVKGNIFIQDIFNLVDKIPIVGGERIRYSFKVPTSSNKFQGEFVVYKIGRKIYPETDDRYVGYTLELCTVDRYRDINLDFSQSFVGTYTNIVRTILTNNLKSNKTLDLDESVGVQRFISPYWSPLTCCSKIATRSMGSNNDPILFYENLDGYKFKTVTNLFSQTPYCKFVIEPARTESSMIPSKAFRRITKFEYHQSHEKMHNMIEGVYGSKVYTYNSVFNILETNTKTYKELVNSNVIPKIDDFPVSVTSDKTEINKISYQLYKSDDSHLNTLPRKIVLGLLDTYLLKIEVPGDNELRVGSIVELDIPSKSVGGVVEPEKYSSGKWIITSLRHFINRDSYSCILELAKDSLNKEFT